jgi:hypothetical protein
MMVRYRSLAQRLRAELQEMEPTLAAVERHWRHFRTTASDHDAFLNSVAFNLHSLYSGLERMFELIAIEVDGGALGGERWHSEMLNQMTLDLPGVRPPVIAKATAAQLDDYRRFRHLVRNIYATNLDPDRIEALVDALPLVWDDVRQELLAFVRFLDQLADADGGRPE